MTDRELIEQAKKARLNSYSPYSHFRVGAALITSDNELFTGCNIENASYPAGCCAERTAIFAAASKGKRKFTKLAIVGSHDDKIEKMTFPCGMCLHVISEFCDDDFRIVLCENDDINTYTLADLMPLRFNAAGMRPQADSRFYF